HAEQDPVIAVENGRTLAALIPGARYRELPGRDHAFLFEGRATLMSELRALVARLGTAASAP
ncbi:MAG TPA: hypothetical protein VNN80_26490, partial [Polyangiaceae bacterium]|nr:hypothetical protein [Polyangiaceae bacterium]